VHQLNFEIRRDLLQVAAGEIATVIDVKHLGNSADRPRRIFLAPDGLAQSEAGLERRGGTQENRVAGDDARVVIDHRGQPRSLRLTVGIENQDIKLSVIGLPGRVRSFRSMAIDEFESVSICRMTLMRQGDQGRIEGGDNRVDAAVCGDRELPLPGDRRDPSMNGGDRWSRFL
jgi:hypothetical protein